MVRVNPKTPVAAFFYDETVRGTGRSDLGSQIWISGSCLVCFFVNLVIFVIFEIKSIGFMAFLRLELKKNIEFMAFLNQECHKLNVFLILNAEMP